jgi:HD-like signal output (HDOD) protein
VSKRDALKRITDRIDNLPTLPAVAARLLETVNDPTTSASDVQNLLRHDQSLAMKVLRLANSSFYGYGGQIKTISHAVVVLGFETIRSIALSASVFGAFGGKG